MEQVALCLCECPGCVLAFLVTTIEGHEEIRCGGVLYVPETANDGGDSGSNERTDEGSQSFRPNGQTACTAAGRKNDHARMLGLQELDQCGGVEDTALARRGGQEQKGQERLLCIGECVTGEMNDVAVARAVEESRNGGITLR